MDDSEKKKKKTLVAKEKYFKEDTVKSFNEYPCKKKYFCIFLRWTCSLTQNSQFIQCTFIPTIENRETLRIVFWHIYVFQCVNFMGMCFQMHVHSNTRNYSTFIPIRETPSLDEIFSQLTINKRA